MIFTDFEPETPYLNIYLVDDMIPKIQEEMANIETHVGRGAGKEQFLESYLDLMRQVNALNQKFLPRIDNPIKNPIENPITYRL